MKPNIVFLDAYSICGRDLSEIAALGNFTAYDSTEPEEVLERCKDAEVIIANKTVLDAEKLRQLPRLRLICVAATGMNNIDLKTAAELGIPVRNAVGYSTHSVSETTICSALALLREVVYYDRYFKFGDYSASPRMFNFDRPTAQIHGKNWGIIGLGNIGREVARLATAFGCNVRYTSTSGIARQEEWEQMPLNDLLAWADVVSVHCPLNEQTHNLINTEQLSKMKPSAVIINVARGGIINESALAEALDNGIIRGAALDVFSSEPLDASSPLFHLRDPYRLLASPHNAWSTVEAIDRLIACVRDNIKEYF